MTDRSADSVRQFKTRLRLARAALWWERFWPACWPATAVLGAFLVLALFDVLPDLPSLWHAAILLGFGAALIVAAGAALHDLAIPDRSLARRRIEQASGLRHRPLQALADRPGMRLDPQSTLLWQAHQRLMQAAASRLRVGLPAAGLAARDPWGLRAVLTMLLMIAAVDAGADWRDRLQRAVAPSLDSAPAAVAASLDIWVTPPDYTGLPPRFLRPAEAETIPIPTGSKLLAQVHGGEGVPKLAIDGQDRDFAAADKENFQISAILSRGQRLAVMQDGAALGSWPIAIIPDHPPTVAFAEPPGSTAHAALRVDYQAADDYGVESVKAVITRPGGKPGEKIELGLALPGLHLKRAHAASFHDLTPHPWAGLPVEIRLVAADAIGQKGESESLRMVLPERVFRNPIARALIDQRKELVKNPKSRLAVAEILGDLRDQPHRYGDDGAVFLALSVARKSLRLNDDARSTAEVEQLLWDTALRIDEAQAPLAARELRRLEQQLQDALAKGAPDQEIERLMSQLRQALDRYLQALAQNTARNPPPPNQPADPSKVVSSRDLQRLLDQARELARAGARDQARQLLSQLQEMLENLSMATPRQAPQQGSGEAQQMMRGMRDMMDRQQQLLDRSFRAEQQDETGNMGRPGEPSGDRSQGKLGMGDAAGQQDSLRHRLGEMMRRLGEGRSEIPDPLGRAERAMRDATEALRGGQPGAAVGPQTDALDQLQQAAREMAEQLQRRLGGDWGRRGDDRSGTEGGEAGDQLKRDPLGRPLSNSGVYDEGDVKIPDWNTLQKSRAILDELRRRAGEPFRPELERDYIDRLLQQF